MPNPTNWLERFEDGDRRNRNSARLLFKGTDIEINNSDFTSTANEQPPEREITYICGLGAKVGCERLSEHSTFSDESHKYRLFSLSGGVSFAAQIRNKQSLFLFPLLSFLLYLLNSDIHKGNTLTP